MQVLSAFGSSVLLLLFAVLEARMQQLQPDVLHAKQMKVEFVQVPQGKRRGAPVKRQETKAETPKAAQSAKKDATLDNPPSKAHASRWIEKLKLEKSNKTKKQSSLRQKLHDRTAAAKGSKGNLMAPGTSMKTISAAKRGKQPESAMGQTQQPSHSKPKASMHYTSANTTKEDPEELCRAAELAEVKEREEMVGEWSPTSAEKLLEDKDGNRYDDAQLNLRCFLEACVFTGDVERAQHCLFFHHRHLSKRKALSISAYNIMMKMWAKKVRANPERLLQNRCFGHLLKASLYYIYTGVQSVYVRINTLAFYCQDAS